MKQLTIVLVAKALPNFKKVGPLIHTHLVGTDPAAILAASVEILPIRGRKGSKPALCEGLAAGRIVDILLREIAPPTNWPEVYEIGRNGTA